MNEAPYYRTGTPVSTPIFIHGQMPRCGTNFLIDVLGNHSDVFREPNQIWEFHHFINVEYLHNYMNRLKKSKHMRELDIFRFRRHIGSAWIKYMREFVDDVKKRILLKEPWVKNLEYFFDYFPEAHLVIIVRDGRNAVASAMKAGFVASVARAMRVNFVAPPLNQPSDFEMVCRLWNESALKVVELLSNDFSDRQNQVLLVRYEALYQNIAEETKRILDFCKLSHDSFDLGKLEVMPIRGSSFLRNSNGNMDFTQGIQPDEKFDPLHRWRSWTQKQHRVFRKCCRTGMQSLGYPIDEAT